MLHRAAGNDVRINDTYSCRFCLLELLLDHKDFYIKNSANLLDDTDNEVHLKDHCAAQHYIGYGKSVAPKFCLMPIKLTFSPR